MFLRMDYALLAISVALLVWTAESYSIYDRKFDAENAMEDLSKKSVDTPPAALSPELLKILIAAVDAGVVSDDGYEPTGAGQDISVQKRYMCRKYFIYNPVRGRCQLALRKGRGGK